ncbi:ankyrin repeat domain-containing protein [uncultured Psychroserpens sp.]|uniref:ankyrin repeat domain-containing protein n=1 Tax=uncultured Psychroserpens sp. TaxID=255436 RepID=UPI0026069438|nr:ankyrin repeat domain-containing protein [uncultured Psychroserpens sp.]
MKKSAVILALALGFSICNLNATTETLHSNTDEVTVYVNEVSPLCKAVATGNLAEVKRLIKTGVDINKKSNGMLPIHYAAKFNRVDIIKVLITAGSEIHTVCDKGLTALRHAEKSNANEAALFLKRFKKVNKRNV